MNYFTRKLTHRDVQALFEITSDPRVTRYLGFKTHITIHDTEKLISDYHHDRGEWQGVFSGMPWDEKLIGVVGIEQQEHTVTFAIYFSPAARGAGRRFSTQAVKEALELPGIKRVWAYCHHLNLPVQRVMERMGAKREGLMRNFAIFPNLSSDPQDCYLYSILPGELKTP